VAKKLSAFEKEFAAARNRGDLKFDFNGKSYTTRRADDPPKRELGMRATPADTSGFTAGRDKPRSGGANIPTPLRKTKPAPLSSETEDEVSRMFGKPAPSEKRAMNKLREQPTGSSAERLIRKQAAGEPEIKSLSYADARKKKLTRGLAAGGKVKMYKKGGKVEKMPKDKKELPFFMKKKKGMNCGGKVAKYAEGGAVKSRGDGICRVKTKGKVC
jgi:hypothetical protein